MRRLGHIMGWLGPLAFLAQPAVAAPTAPSSAANPDGEDPIGRYLSELEQAGILRQDEASLEKIKDTLTRAEASLVAGDARTATTLLFGVVESPRYRSWSYSPEYQNAELLLGRTLARGGAHVSARRYLLRVLARGPGQQYFTPAFRALVDVALESRDYLGVLAALDGLTLKDRLPKDSESELAYLRGKIEHEGRQHRAAEGWFSEVDRRSRFYASALYFRGLIRALSGDFQVARAAFCEIVEQRDKDSLSFYIDGRYFALKDLAHLALGRVAHEQERYDEAYYFYMQVPQDSERLPDALFEAAWSMFQRGEHGAARAFLDQLERMFPVTALAPEIAILRANLDLKSCAFDRARTRLADFEKAYAPVKAEVRRALDDPARRQALYARLTARGAVGAPDDRDGRLLLLLKVDPRFFRFHGYLQALDIETAEAAHAAGVWDELARRRGREKPAVVSADAARLLADVRALATQAGDDPEVARQARRLAARVERAARPAVEQAALAAESRQAQALGEQAEALRARLLAATAALASEALQELDARLANLLRQSRLGQIDAVIGKKKKLEVEIANLAQGRFPPEMFRKLQVEGLMRDDEEYWPFEGEHWADEYERFK